MNPRLSRTLESVYPDARPSPEGLAKMQSDFEAHRGPDGIANLRDWAWRRAQYMHAAYGIEPQERKLPGRLKEGVPDASIGVAQAHDGLWYARYGYWLGDGGGFTPLECRHHAAESQRVQAKRIEGWLSEQMGPQQMGLGI